MLSFKQFISEMPEVRLKLTKDRLGMLGNADRIKLKKPIGTKIDSMGPDYDVYHHHNPDAIQYTDHIYAYHKPTKTIHISLKGFHDGYDTFQENLVRKHPDAQFKAHEFYSTVAKHMNIESDVVHSVGNKLNWMKLATKPGHKITARTLGYSLGKQGKIKNPDDMEDHYTYGRGDKLYNDRSATRFTLSQLRKRYKKEK